MTSAQVKYILNQGGVTDTDSVKKKIKAIFFTAAHSTVYTKRYDKVTFDNTNDLLVLLDNNGEMQYMDYVDINAIVYYPNETKDHALNVFRDMQMTMNPNSNLE